MFIQTSPPTLSQSLATIHLFAQTPETSARVVTANVELINQWGRLRKIFMCCFKGGYLCQLHPKEATEEFKARLLTVISSDEYNGKMPEACAKACITFNQLIRKTNSELHPSKRVPEEALLVDLSELALLHRVPPERIQSPAAPLQEMAAAPREVIEEGLLQESEKLDLKASESAYQAQASLLIPSEETGEIAEPLILPHATDSTLSLPADNRPAEGSSDPVPPLRVEDDDKKLLQPTEEPPAKIHVSRHKIDQKTRPLQFHMQLRQKERVNYKQ